METVSQKQLSDAEIAERIKNCWRMLNRSCYAVERAFNDMPLAHKQIIIAVANINPAEDLINATSCGYKLGEYTHSGRDKIAEAVKLLSQIRAHFPPFLNKASFHQIDPNPEVEK